MSTGARLPYDEAFELARQVSDRLKPTVQRLKCVGSLRRQRAQVGDIEFLALPHFDEGLFGESTPIIDPVKSALTELGTWVKGGQRMMQITDLLGREGARLDLYLVHPPANWYVLLAIRTGPSQLGRYVVAHCRKHGFRVDRGRALVTESGAEASVDSEEAFFALADVPCRPPNERDAQAIELWNDVGRYREVGA